MESREVKSKQLELQGAFKKEKTKASSQALIEFYIEDSKFDFVFCTVDNLMCDIILGINFIVQFQL